MIWNPNSLDHPRMGLLVPKYRSTAVARNRLRRRLRELWRTEIQPVQGSTDLVIRARSAAYQAPFATLRGELRGWCNGLPAGS